MKLACLTVALLAVTSIATAADTYNIDPSHTFPSFEADHMGLSTFRGKFNKTSGTVTLDRAAKTGMLDIAIDASTLDFGQPALNKHAMSKDMFNVEQFPAITYKSKSVKFDGDRPVAVDGELTMLGVTKPVMLTINKFKCIIHPRLKREVCGADVHGSFKRTDFGLGYGGAAFAPEVNLAIQVEAVKAE